MEQIIRIPAFKDNYIWLLRQGTASLVVDPGDARPVLALLAREGWSLNAILITHHHPDHQGGVASLLAQYPAEVFGPAAESITGLTRPLQGGETIRIASPALEFQVFSVPGHTLGHLAYYGAGRLFCGDTLFGGGCGRLFEGTPAQMADSLARLATLPDETEVYCAHEYTEDNLRFALAVEPGNLYLQRRVEALTRARGEPTIPSSIALEKATNPFLRCDVAEVIASAHRRVPGARSRYEVFAALREWKNVW
jgi:hydroxyacylglutathione hydrolase